MENMDEKYRDKNPFTVPDGYFDSLTERVMAHTENRNEVHRPTLWEILRPYAGIAAMFVMTMGVMYLIIPDTEKRGDVREVETVAYGEGNGEVAEEDIFDSGFNPTSDEIIEYLSAEIDSYELLLADVY